MRVGTVQVEPGPAVLDGLADGPGAAAHRRRHGPLPRLRGADLLQVAEAIALRGRGGAAFPFAVKVKAVLDRRRRPVVVVNLSEGEPLSEKDGVLALTRPHLVLDGATAAAAALHARELFLVLPADRPDVESAVRTALAERDDAVAIHCRRAAPRFVSGQARAVIELLSGRENLPVTSWQPEAVSGLGGRPTLLSNAETFAHLGLAILHGPARYRQLGTAEEPGTTLLTIAEAGRPTVVREVAYGARLGPELPASSGDRFVLVGGFHGAWATWPTVAGARVSLPHLRRLGIPLGAGIVHLPAPGACPVRLTADILGYLADESAGRCGPCRFGLPALAAATRRLAEGQDSREEIHRLAGLVTGRGACAHPDGTVRLVRSLLAAAPAEVAAHARGGCVAAHEVAS